MGNSILLQSKGITKAFGPTIALKGVDVEIKRGEIHGIIGENGSGKSTFSSIVAGIQNSDVGELYLNGDIYKPENTLDAGRQGVSMVAQEQNTINGITVAANIFLGEEERFTRYGYLNIIAMNREAKKALDFVSSYHIEPDVQVDDLSFEDRKLVELARSMYIKPELLIIDETTTALTIKGREILYSIMRRMRDEGKSIIFISHDVDEMMNLSDSITILKDGCITANLSKPEFGAKKIKQLMVGREIAANFYRSDYVAKYDQEIILKAENIAYADIKDISFELHKGEILGIGGLAECGMHDLGKILFGLIKPSRGTVTAKGTTKINNTEKAIKAGIGYVSKNRDMEVLMPVCSIKDNICIVSLKTLTKFGLITRKREKDFAQKWAEKLNIKANSVEQFVTALSGGNKQKVALAKWLGKNSDILILDCPTRGIDVGVKAAIYKLMEELKRAGNSILMISEELPELIGMSDRVLILKDGEIKCEYERNQDLSEAKLIEYMI